MKKYALENKVLIKGKVFELTFDGSDEGDDYIKWHNFHTNYGDQKEFYMLQICQENDPECEPYFYIGLYTCNEDGMYDVEWFDLDDYLKDTNSTIDKIKDYLIKKSDELINECTMKCNMCDGKLDYIKYKDTHIWICRDCPNIQFECVEDKDVENLHEYLNRT